MPTVGEDHAAASSAAPTVSAIVARRVVLIALAIGVLIVAIGAGLLLATSDHLVDPIKFGLHVAVMVVGWFSAALYWLVRRPGNRLGLVLFAVAVCSAALSLQGATEPLLHSIGVLADWLLVLLVFYVVFAFPEGRTESRIAWVLLGAAALERLESYVPSLLFSPVVHGNLPFAGCTAACPANPFMIADRPAIADGLLSSDISTYCLLATRSAIFVYLIYRLATATRPRRRALLPVYVPVLMLLAPILVLYLARGDIVHLDAGAIPKLIWLANIGLSALPYGFLLSIVVSTFFAAAALKKIVSRVVEYPTASELRRTLAGALDDPSLELGFRVDRADGFVDSAGTPLALAPAAGRSSTPVTLNGETVAVIMHDAALDTDPELLSAASQATVLALENGRLDSELRTTTAELAASRARAVTAGDLERRKVERDLHDGAQQQLAGLSIELALTRELAKEDPEVVAHLDVLGQGLETALSELRDLAHGIYPPVLRDFGLQSALAAAARRSIPPAALVTHGISRYPTDIETAVYFCCLEGLQNAGKHAGPGATAVIRLWERGGRLSFEIVDDGVGYDVHLARHAGQGLANMSERITTLGGTLVLESTPGRGTTVRADIPVDGATTQRVGPVAHSGSEGDSGDV